MEHFAGLDVSVKETSVCIVDDTCSTPTAGFFSISPCRSAHAMNACSERHAFFAVVGPLSLAIAAPTAATIGMVMLPIGCRCSGA